MLDKDQVKFDYHLFLQLFTLMLHKENFWDYLSKVSRDFYNLYPYYDEAVYEAKAIFFIAAYTRGIEIGEEFQASKGFLAFEKMPDASEWEIGEKISYLGKFLNEIEEENFVGKLVPTDVFQEHMQKYFGFVALLQQMGMLAEIEMFEYKQVISNNLLN